MSTPEERVLALTKRKGRIEVAECASLFDQLKPITPEQLLGEWEGGSFDTGHPLYEVCKSLKWAGKNFKSVENVDPMILYDDNDQRFRCEEYGSARVREVKFRGVVSAAMIYDNIPMIDNFRCVSENCLMGAAEDKNNSDEGVFYFYLKK